MLNKLPPIEKIYEAYSAIADNRITLYEDYAIVYSSNRSKEYTVPCSNDEKEKIQIEVHRVYESIKLLDIEVKRGNNGKYR